MVRVRLCVCLALAVAAAGRGWAQEPTSAPAVPSGVAAEAPASPAGLASVALRATQSAERLAALEADLATMRAAEEADGWLARHREKVAELAAARERLDGAANAGYVQYADLRTALRAAVDALAKDGEKLAAALGRLDGMRAEWSAELQFWETTAASLEAEPGADALRPNLAAAQANGARAQELLAAAMGPLLERQRQLGELQAQLQVALAAVEASQRALREALFRRSGFPILSREFAAQLGPHLIPELLASLTQVAWPGAEFFQAWAWALVLQVGLVGALGMALGRHRQQLAASDRWRFLGERPWSVAVFAGTAAVAPLYGAAAPPAWRLVLWLVAAPAAARLLGGLMRHRWPRALLYLLAGLFVATQAMRVFGIPMPLFRLYVFGVGLLGAPFCLWRAQINRRRGGPWLYVLALRGGAAVLTLTCLAQVAGYAAFATHLVTASIQTTFVVLLAWTLALLSRGALEYGLGPDSVLHRLLPLRRSAEQLARRLGRVIDAGVAVTALGVTLEVWRIYPSPADAVAAVAGLGVSIGGFHLTLGVVVGAAAILYASVLLSDLVQELLMAQVYPRSHMEWGVRVSMNRLVHYGVVAVGFFIAVGALGLDFQNITILAGAFSIGIGFGLQNIVNNFVSGLILLFERPIKVGDVVMLDGEWATIKKLGLRATIVQTFGRADVIVPNSDLVANKVVNWTLYDRLIRLSVPVGVAYGSDVARTMAVLQEVAEAHPEVQGEPAPQVLFRNFGDSSLDFELRVWVDAERFMDVNSDLHREIDRRFREAAIEISFPQRDLHLRTVSEPARRALRTLVGRPAGGGEAPSPSPSPEG